jgi:hypothetical protein
MTDNLLLKFRIKDTPYGISRDVLKAISKELDMSETMVVHLALSRFAKEVLPGYEADDGALSKGDLSWVREQARGKLPHGKVLSRKSLL